MDSRERFSITVDDYERYRPDYPAALYDALLVLVLVSARAPLAVGDVVVDVGCGTGISTRPWAARGMTAVGVEPNAAMRARAIAAGGGVRYVDGAANATTLPDGAAALVMAAQAFHWFDIDAALVEWRRIARPGACFAAVWNLRDHGSPFMRAYDALLASSLDEYARSRRASRCIELLRAHPSLSPQLDELHFAHAQTLDRQGLVGRARSSSYVAHAGADRDAFEAKLSSLFDEFASAGTVTFAYDTIALIWR